MSSPKKDRARRIEVLESVKREQAAIELAKEAIRLQEEGQREALRKLAEEKEAEVKAAEVKPEPIVIEKAPKEVPRKVKRIEIAKK